MFLRPLITPGYVRTHLAQSNQQYLDQKDLIKAGISKLYSSSPDISVVIPAYNEEQGILRTISTLSQSITNQKVEFIVVDNNSNDRTQEFVEDTGVTLLVEKNQGVKHARNTGLFYARGKVVLNADADTLYSPYWIDQMSAPLSDPNVACTYGCFAFYSEENKARFFHFLYESFGDIYKQIINRNKEEAMYVYGISSGYRRQDGLMVDGYEHPVGANEDGYLALKLSKAFGKLKRVEGNKSLVWTSDRKLQLDGGVFRAFTKRAKRFLDFSGRSDN
ncbi:glycosyltransferase [Parapedobacter tibetensis]|uniref:glycosyltransferase n=1 Tax=Parapedobacter tibetensis TaxID=2972951 RepID=UPI00214DDA46|nr:glycosyltransferase family A protein [Parapedobacter tibetensis]